MRVCNGWKWAGVRLLFLAWLTPLWLLAGPVRVTVDDTVTHQEIAGVGASITDSSAWLMMNALSPEARAQLIDELFSPVKGIGLSFLRQPMGTSDFRRNDYTYADMPHGLTDPALAHFSIEADRPFILPVLKQVLMVSPGITIMGTPWSPPAWMKTSGKLESGELIQDEAVRAAFCEYFVRYITAYAAEGIPIHAVTLQNEPAFEPGTYPGMKMDWQTQRDLIVRLGRRFTKEGIKTRLFIWDHNWDNPGYPDSILKDDEARRHVAGVAFHAYKGNVAVQSDLLRAHPGIAIYLTECGGSISSNFAGDLMWDVGNLIIASMRNGAGVVAKWNLALDEEGGPKRPGGHENARGIVTINRRDGRITRNEEYYALGHVARFVRPGAVRIASSSASSVAFRTVDGGQVLLLLNDRPEAVPHRVSWRGREVLVTLPPVSVATLVWPRDVGAAVDMWITSGDRTHLLEKQTVQRVLTPPVAPPAPALRRRSVWEER